MTRSTPLRGSRIALASLFVIAAPDARAQTTVRPAYRQLPEAREIALARSAAPPRVSDSAAVYVWRPGGHVLAVRGTNGVACIVTRDHPESLYPVCYDAEAARTILPVELYEIRRREEGVTEERLAEEIAAGFASGKFEAPKRPAMSYMMSREQILYAGANGRRVGPWMPHVMLYYPGMRAAEMAVASGGPDRMAIALEGTPRAHLVVPVRDWSGVARAPASP